MTDDLTAFLCARLNDDARLAEEAGDSWYKYLPDQQIDSLSDADHRHITRQTPFHVLSDVAAKLQTVALHTAEPGQHPDYCWHDKHELPCPTLRLLAAVYREHPDYRPEWRA